MPTIYRENGFRFFFFSNENDEEPHVHVEKADGLAKLTIIYEVQFEWCRGFTPPAQFRILKIVELRRNDFLNSWYAYFNKHDRFH